MVALYGEYLSAGSAISLPAIVLAAPARSDW